MARPIVMKILPFDADKPCEISLSWSGGRAHANRILIYDNETNDLVFDDVAETFALQHTIPAHTLTNGKRYVIQARTYDAEGTASPLSDKVLFQTLETPDFHFDNVPENGRVENASLAVSVSYHSPDSEKISTYKFHLYDSTQKLLLESDALTDASDLSYVYRGLESNAAYYIRCLGVTVNGMELDTGFVGINVRYGTPNTYSRIYAETGEVLARNVIRSAVIDTLERLAGITNHRIDDVGEPMAMPEYNEDWADYRKKNQATWNAIPFDQEFSAGCSVLSILTAFRDLYPNYEMFFDMESNAFTCQLKPTCYEDDVFLDNDFLQSVLLSESTSVDMTTVRNVCEVWGSVIEADFYGEECTYSDNTYTSAIDGYEEGYGNGDVIALKIPAANQAGAQLNLNQLGAVGIFHESEEPISANELRPEETYAFRIRKRHADQQEEIRAYLLGQWQVHAINVLTNGKKSGQFVAGSDGEPCEVYSKAYFQQAYHCDRVDLTVIPDSPFTVEKLGEIPDVKVSGEFENITSNDLAADRAKWENWKNCRLTDNVTITTALLPFVDVNKKVSYQRSDSDREHQYVISSVSHDFAGFTTTITMYRFYPLYDAT